MRDGCVVRNEKRFAVRLKVYRGAVTTGTMKILPKRIAAATTPPKLKQIYKMPRRRSGTIYER